MDPPLPVEPEGLGLWLVTWHRSGDSRYGSRGEVLVRYERSTDAEPHRREWRENNTRYEAVWYGRIAEAFDDGSVRIEEGNVFGAELFSWQRRSPTSHPPGNAPPARGPF